MKKKPTLSILDYQMGNISSLKHSLKELGYKSNLVNNPEEVKQSDILILPGVGAFKQAMKNLEISGLKDATIDRHRLGLPIIGICLGMQLLSESSDENGETMGLGLVQGVVKRLNK